MEWQPINTLTEDVEDDYVAFCGEIGGRLQYDFAQRAGGLWLGEKWRSTSDVKRVFTHWARILPPTKDPIP